MRTEKNAIDRWLGPEDYQSRVMIVKNVINRWPGSKDHQSRIMIVSDWTLYVSRDLRITSNVLAIFVCGDADKIMLLKNK